MLCVDHSLTYRSRSLRHVQHRMRLGAIERVVACLGLPPHPTYADLGCSNGFVTARIARLIRARRTVAIDHVECRLQKGRESHPDIEFRCSDLNSSGAVQEQFDLVTCFETLEHVGDLSAAIGNFLSSIGPGGIGLATAPIEIGPVGIAKFVVKMALGYGYGVLPRQRLMFWRYLWALLSGARISRFRRGTRDSWGTHFGFDYRDVDDELARRAAVFVTWNSSTTRFYLVSTHTSIRRIQA